MPTRANQRTDYNDAFREALEILNPDQRAALDRIDGPVMVLAGPGTGKTHILAARIGRILLETDAAPHNILCLTFTNAGVRAMRERLIRFIGPEAHRIHIHTFHSFCQNVIQDNLDRLGHKDLQPLSDLERIQTIRKLIDGLDVDNPLKRGRNNAYFYEPHLTNLFSQMKQEAWTPEMVESRIAEYLDDLPNREEFQYKRGNKKRGIQKGDLKTKDIEKEADKYAKLAAGARLFTKYQSALKKNRRYDFNDMILKVLRAFKEFPYLLRRYQEQYLYFLVDEFQDTNGSQYEVLQNLAEYWDSPNVFIVGDDDQSIFEFQGARLHNLTDFYKRYRDGVSLVMLKDNYRSTQPILDASHTLIQHNDIRLVNELKDLGLEKKLAAKSPQQEDPPLPRLLTYPNRLAEISDIVRQIESLADSGVPLQEIAVIYAKHMQSLRLIRLLDRKGIPYHTRKQENLLELPIIEQLRTMLGFIDRETRAPGSGDPQLFRMLHFRLFGINPMDIASVSAIRRAYPLKERPMLRCILSGSVKGGGEVLVAPEAIKRLSGYLESWIGNRYEFSLPVLLERLINQSGMLAWILKQEGSAFLLSAVKTFFDHVRQECARDPKISLEMLLEHLDLMEEHGVSLPMDHEVGKEEGVELVTAHSAKGLEFDHVFMLDVVPGGWEPNNQKGLYMFSLPETLTYSGDEDAMEASRRLFYVSMTRARKGLTLSHAHESAEGKGLLACRFVDELLEGSRLEVINVQPSEADMREAQVLYLFESRLPGIKPVESAAVDRLLEEFRMSITSLNSYLRCPLSFFYDYILQVPSVPGEASLYGSATHEALELLFVEMTKTPEKIFPPLARFLAFFEGAMEKRRAFFSPEAFDRRLEMGKRDLAGYYEQNHGSWPHEVLVEKGVWRIDFEGVPLRGIIDRVDILDNRHVRLLDYKSGISKSAKAIKKRKHPDEKDPDGGSHWRQMVFYKILFEQWDKQDLRVSATDISYLEPGTDGHFSDESVEVGPGDVDFLAQLIRDTWSRIQAREFFEGCKDDRCEWCKFIRHHGEVLSFSDPELESLDDNLA